MKRVICDGCGKDIKDPYLTFDRDVPPGANVRSRAEQWPKDTHDRMSCVMAALEGVSSIDAPPPNNIEPEPEPETES